jgi:hypothetical protein
LGRASFGSQRRQSVTNSNASHGLHLTDETVQEIVGALGKSVKPRVLYRTDPQRMTEEAVDICQKNARAVLGALRDALPVDHWLRMEIGDLLDEAVEVWDRYPF